jgi:hypothetical protein
MQGDEVPGQISGSRRSAKPGRQKKN